MDNNIFMFVFVGGILGILSIPILFYLETKYYNSKCRQEEQRRRDVQKCGCRTQEDYKYL